MSDKILIPQLVADKIRFYQIQERKKELLILIKQMNQEGYYGYGYMLYNATPSLETPLSDLENLYQDQLLTKISRNNNRNYEHGFLHKFTYNYRSKFQNS